MFGRESRHDRDEREEIELARKTVEELHDLIKLEREELKELRLHNTVVGGIIYLRTDPMIELKPGNSPQFGVTPLPAGVVTQAANVKVTSADPADVVTLNAADPTGLTFTNTINPAAVEPVKLTLTWSYTNSDGSVVNVVGNFTEAEIITGGVMAQIG